MELIHYIFLGSITVLALLAVLFRLENKQGRRLFLKGVRQFFDRVIRGTSETVERFATYVGSGTVRKTGQFLLSSIVKILLCVVRKIETSLSRVQMKNYRVVDGDLEHVDERMSAVNIHAASIKMDPEEKRKKRLKMLK